MRQQRYRKVNLFLDFYRLSREWIQFYLRSFQSPYPTLIKMKTLTSNSIPHAPWIETGTYRGSTTRYLAKRYPKVISIEPSTVFYGENGQQKALEFIDKYRENYPKVEYTYD